jgi:hypothetical protein
VPLPAIPRRLQTGQRLSPTAWPHRATDEEEEGEEEAEYGARAASVTRCSMLPRGLFPGLVMDPCDNGIGVEVPRITHTRARDSQGPGWFLPPHPIPFPHEPWGTGCPGLR